MGDASVSPKFSRKTKFGLESKKLIYADTDRKSDERDPVKVKGKGNKAVSIPKFNMDMLHEAKEFDKDGAPLFNVV